METFLKLCRECKYTIACWKTISGGIPVLVITDGGEEEHLVAFLAVSDYYEKLLGIKSDPACKDYSHLSFVSYDPNAYYKEDSLLFSVPSQHTGLDVLLEQFLKYNSIAPGSRNVSLLRETAPFCLHKLCLRKAKQLQILQHCNICATWRGLKNVRMWRNLLIL
ncbi:MAG: BT4734/BF3469 family protein, partial [Bacteroidales bacterium]|nr:BT4734/BF3469 family protein [Bacteroidales bacterium]